MAEVELKVEDVFTLSSDLVASVHDASTEHHRRGSVRDEAGLVCGRRVEEHEANSCRTTPWRTVQDTQVNV